MDNKRANNVYVWLWLSPLLTLPTLFFIANLIEVFLYTFDWDYEIIDGAYHYVQFDDDLD